MVKVPGCFVNEAGRRSGRVSYWRLCGLAARLAASTPARIFWVGVRVSGSTTMGGAPPAGTIGGVAGNLLAPFDADSWEFPLLLKKKFGGPDVVAVSVKPFVDVGASFRRLGDIGNIGGFITGNNDEVDKSATGFVVGGGVEIRLLFIRLSPELRFTRWGTDNFRAGVANILQTNRNQGQLLVGIHF